jgi:hypothetical protein
MCTPSFFAADSVSGDLGYRFHKTLGRSRPATS